MLCEEILLYLLVKIPAIYYLSFCEFVLIEITFVVSVGGASNVIKSVGIRAGKASLRKA